MAARAQCEEVRDGVRWGRSGEVWGDPGRSRRRRHLVDGERAQVERHGLRVLVLVAEGIAEVDQVLGHFGVVGAKSLLINGQGGHVEGDRVRRLALGAAEEQRMPEVRHEPPVEGS